MHYAYPNFLNKGINPLQMQVPNCSDYLSIFVDACEDLIMADDVVVPSNPLVLPVEEEELEEALLDMNVSQWSREKKPSRRVVRTRVNRLAWDR
jgi:hypothetical protein